MGVVTLGQIDIAKAASKRVAPWVCVSKTSSGCHPAWLDCTKTAQNVAAGVAGLVVPILWFGMDWQGTASKEAQALQARQQYLGALAVQKKCGSR